MENTGLENLGSYMWNTKKRCHKFCKTCGSSLAIDLRMGEPGQPGEKDPRRDIIAVNVSQVYFSSSSGSNFGLQADNC